MTDAKNAKKCPKFMCEKCDFTCSKQSNYDKHLSTGKHEILTNTYTKNAEKCQTYICSCGKSYKYRQSLYSHKKKCNYIEEIKNEVVEVENAVVEVGTEESDRSLIIKLMNENMELHKTIKEIIPKIGNNNNTTNNNTTNNNTFNLNVFLNETCKDALNITDFIDSLRVQCNEMKEIETIGFAEVAAKLLIKELSGMDATKRPIHCSDLKRETLYIKDNDVWEKESENKKHMVNMVGKIQQQSYSTLDDWASKSPGYIKEHHPYHHTYMDVVGKVAFVDIVKDVNKITKRVAKEVLIDKTK